MARAAMMTRSQRKDHDAYSKRVYTIQSPKDDQSPETSPTARDTAGTRVVFVMSTIVEQRDLFEVVNVPHSR